jgi:hypothetical protein
VLWADGALSGLGGLVLVAFPGAVASFVGLSFGVPVAVVGVALLVFAAAVLSNARRDAPSRGEAAVTVALNLAWVVGSVVVITGGWLSAAGNWVLAVAGDGVLVLAILEVVGLRRTAAGRGGWEPAQLRP